VTGPVPGSAAGAPSRLGVLAALALVVAACTGAPPATGSPEQTVAVTGTPTGPAAGPGAATPPVESPEAPPRFGGPGPWPVANQVFGAAEGIGESPVVGASTDEAQNLWVATHTALYLLRPGETTFRRYGSRDGLHLMDNPASIREDYCGSTAVVTGAAAEPGISTIVGGADGEVFVGYFGASEMVGDCTDPAFARHSGKIDRVRLRPDDSLEVTRFDLASVGFGMNFWHNRSVYRLVYDHVHHPHTLYAGANHGVDLILPDRYRDPRPGEWSGSPLVEWLGDHLHPHVCYHAACPLDTEGDQRMGDWYGLAIAPDGDLWTAGRYAAGKIRWDPLGPYHWEHDRGGAEAFSEAFGDPYPGNPPVFQPPLEGDPVSLTAVAVSPDETVWFGNKRFFGEDQNYGIASFRRGQGFTYHSPFEVGMSELDVQDIVALPDGRLVFAGPTTGLVVHDPATGRHQAIRAGQGIPDDRVTRLELDTMVDPPALHVSTAGGAASLRVLP
jgi:hypothetical protein